MSAEKGWCCSAIRTLKEVYGSLKMGGKVVHPQYDEGKWVHGSIQILPNFQSG